MITFIFRVPQQSRDADVPLQVSVLVKLKVDIESATSSLRCPNHEFNSSATILLTGFYSGYKWEVINACCREYKRAIESSVPPQANESRKYFAPQETDPPANTGKHETPDT